jgi:hypothetical protein
MAKAKATTSTTTKKVAAKAETPKQEVAPVVEKPVETPVAVEAPVEETATEPEMAPLATLDAFIKNMQENIKYQQVMLKTLTAVRRELKTLTERVGKLEAKAAKATQVKASRKRGGNGQPLRKSVPVYSKDFSAFIEKHHGALLNKDDGSKIVETIEKDEAGHVLVSREACLKLVAAYIRQNNLNKFDDKKLISLDGELQKIISPKDKDGNAIVYNDAKGKAMKNVCSYKDLMGSIAPHLKQ